MNEKSDCITQIAQATKTRMNSPGTAPFEFQAHMRYTWATVPNKMHEVTMWRKDPSYNDSHRNKLWEGVPEYGRFHEAPFVYAT